MAKKSQINRNKKREKMVAQYAAKRAALKAKARRHEGCRRKTASPRASSSPKLPRNSSQDAHPQSLRTVGPSEGLLPQAEAVAYRAARSCEFRPDPWHDQGKLVRRTEIMAINDPIGDLLARIRNGQLRGLAKIELAELAAARPPARRAEDEGFIRGYAEVEMKGEPPRARDRTEISRRPAGHSRAEARLDAGPPRL